MKLERMRYYEAKCQRRVHQSSPRNEVPEVIHIAGQHWHDHRPSTYVSGFCLVGPNTNHSHCLVPGCTCACHEQTEWWGD